MDAQEWTLLAIGFLVAYAVVAWFRHRMRNRGFALLAIYRIAAGIAGRGWAVR